MAIKGLVGEREKDFKLCILFLNFVFYRQPVQRNQYERSMILYSTHATAL